MIRGILAFSIAMSLFAGSPAGAESFGAAAGLNSGQPQAFTVADPSTIANTMTITAGAAVMPTMLNGIRIQIPAVLPMSWDALGPLPLFGGTAAGRVDRLSFPGARVLQIDLKSDFVANETLTIGGIRLASFLAAGAGHLAMSLDRGVTFPFQDAATKGIGAPTISSAIDQVFHSNDATSAATMITVTDDAITPRILAATDLRIRIPAAFGMTWDSSVLAPVFGGSAFTQNFVGASVTYEDGNRTLVVNVNTNFTIAANVLTISGVAFTGFAVSPPSHLELETNNANTVADLDSKTISVTDPPTLVSPVDQVFTVGDPATAAATITVADPGTGGSIQPAHPIRITIPASVAMTWDPSVTQPAMSGTAATNNRVSLTVTYANSNKTLVVAVNAAFAGSEALTIDGLAFANFTAGSAAAALTLDCDGDPAVDASDPQKKSIGAPTIFSGAPQTFSVGDAPTAISPITVADGQIARITTTHGVRLRIPAAFPMTWLTSDTTATFSVPGKLSPTVTYEDGGRTAVLAVLADFGPNDSVIISGLSFANFTTASAPDFLELEVNNLGTVAAQDINAIRVVDPAAPPPAAPPVDAGGSNGNGNCGLLGVEVLAIIGLLRIARRRA